MWDLSSEMVGQCADLKLAYEVPRSTHTNLVEHCLASELTPVRTELLARFVKFYNSLQNSQSFEVRALVNIVSNDIRSTTARNIALVETETGKQMRNLSPKLVRELIKIKDIPVNQDWRISLLPKLLNERRALESELSKSERLDQIIDSLCSS